MSEAIEEFAKELNIEESELGDYIALCNRDLEHAPCDPEGATKEQDEYMDSIINDYIKDVEKLMK